MAEAEVADFEFGSGADVESSKAATVTTGRSSTDSGTGTSLASELMVQQARLAPNLVALSDHKMCGVIKCPEKKNGKRSKYCRGHCSAFECIQRQHFPRMSL
jgi:nicotinic acid phosphoribosyltransferase